MQVARSLLRSRSDTIVYRPTYIFAVSCLPVQCMHACVVVYVVCMYVCMYVCTGNHDVCPVTCLLLLVLLVLLVLLDVQKKLQDVVRKIDDPLSYFNDLHVLGKRFGMPMLPDPGIPIASGMCVLHARVVQYTPWLPRH